MIGPHVHMGPIKIEEEKTHYFSIQHMEPPNRYGDNKKSKKKRNLRYGHYFSKQHMGPP